MLGVSIEFSKAFDNVNYHILLRKLEHYSIRGNNLNWFQSYLKIDCNTFKSIVPKTLNFTL